MNDSTQVCETCKYWSTDYKLDGFSSKKRFGACLLHVQHVNFEYGNDVALLVHDANNDGENPFYTPVMFTRPNFYCRSHMTKE